MRQQRQHTNEELMEVESSEKFGETFPHADLIRQSGFAAYAEATKGARDRDAAQIADIFRRIEDGTFNTQRRSQPERRPSNQTKPLKSQGTIPMDINAAFPSDFLKAADLQNRPHILAMSYVQMEKVGDDTKPCVYFQGKQRGLLLNKTNANAISALYGTNTERWMGQQIEIFPTTTDFQGKLVDCIRVRPAGVNVGSPAYQGGVQAAPVTNQPQQGAGQPANAPTTFNPDVPPTQEYVVGTSGNVGDTTMDDEIPFR